MTVVEDCGREIKSNIQRNSIGIAQRSILGPILFVIFLNDLSNIENNFAITNYADDTNLLVPGSNIHDLTTNAENAFEITNNWFSQNKVLLNETKTKLVLFRTKLNKVEKPDNIHLCKKNIYVR